MTRKRKQPVRKERCPYCRRLFPFYMFQKHTDECEALR